MQGTTKAPINDLPASDINDLIVKIVNLARTYLEKTGRPLPIDGELGELYAKAQLGIDLYEHNVHGADGFQRASHGGDEVQVKTISPHRTRQKRKNIVHVKYKGKWSKLAIISIGKDYSCAGTAIATKRGLKEAFKKNGGTFDKRAKAKPVSLAMLKKAEELDRKQSLAKPQK